MNAILPLSTPLFPRETATSYMSRLAQANGVDAATLGLELDVVFQSVIDGKSSSLRKLAALGGINDKALSEWTPAYLEKGTYVFREELFHGQTIRSPKVRGCPACLKADVSSGNEMYLRGHWAVPHVTACTVHGHPLVVLWHEKVIYSRLDSAAKFRAIEQSVLSREYDVPHRKVTPFDYWLDNRLVYGPTDNWLDGFSLHAAATFCHLLGHSLMRHITSAPSRVEKEDRWMQYELGYAVASKGEAAVRYALRELQELPGGPSDGPKKIFPLLYDRLARDYADKPDYREFRSILREHMLETWPLGPGDDLMGEPVTVRHLHSVKTAARVTGIDTRRLRKTLVAEGILSDAMRARPDAWAVFDAQKAQPFLDTATVLLDAKAFQEAMAMSRSQFNGLVADDILVPAIPADVKAIWDPQVGIALIERLLEGAILLRQAQHSWCQLSKSAARLKIRPGEIIQAVLDDHLRRIGNHADFDGFSAIYVDHDEVSAFFGNESPKALSLERFAKSVGIGNPTHLKRLVTHGDVQVTRKMNPRTRAQQDYISERDAAAFHERFFTLRTMAVHYGATWLSDVSAYGSK
ncbi:TniQ family protein [Parasedimentitalea maritima]|uniref:TniQ domain-containing protein n=1 Tax=Parasedimentitalea maritima TaxID=2578117 RepID=A0A6A4RA44_9RHOB|nr:TniQ family protein [Zongyanglinia marina]KAE9625091.1 hypothetical protein GP644_22740 [Zongyanglinia marina]